MFEGLFQPTHLILILIVVLLVFGPNKLPQIGAGLGKSIRDFKKAIGEPGGDAEAGRDAPSAAQVKQLPAPPAMGTVAITAQAEEKKD